VIYRIAAILADIARRSQAEKAESLDAMSTGQAAVTWLISQVPFPFMAQRALPVLPVRDLSASLDFYRRLGFDTREWDEGGYGFATLDGIEIHLEVVPDYSGSKPAAILFVDDADQLAQAWISSGFDVRPPEDKEWGLHEGELIDLDGNIIRFGSPLG